MLKRALGTFAAMGGVAACAHAQLFTVRTPGPSGLQPNVIYFSAAGTPAPVGGGAGMGVPSPFDDIDAISKNVEDPRDGPGDTHKEYTIWFGVDASSTGLPPEFWPEVLPPFNVANQALLRQQRSDIYMSTEGFSLAGGTLPVPPSMGLQNNALVVNQSQSYPHSWGLLPSASPTVLVGAGVQQDELDGGARGEPPSPGQPLYFSVSSGSPSLPNIVPGVLASGANIYVDLDINTPGTENIYAPAGVLGLAIEDDIDAMAVMDGGIIGVYDPDDAVLFTLARGSPSIALFGGSPANILVSRGGVASLFVEHVTLGLAMNDHVDAMDIVEIVNGSVLRTIEAEVGPPFLCPPDLTTTAVPGTPGYGVSNGVLNNDDFFYYLAQFAAGNLLVADLTTTAVPGTPGYGVPNGILNNDDFFYYLASFAAGC